MARKTVVSLDADKTVALGKDTKYIEGFYLGSKQIPSKKSKSGFQTVHVLETESGNVGIWGFKKLDDDLGQVQKNVMAYITYKGKTTLNNGNTMHLVKVEHDEEIVRDGGVYVEATTDDSSDDSSGDSSYEPSEADFQEADEIEEEEVAAPPARVTRPAAPARPTGVSPEQAAKAKALLEKHRNKSA